MKCKYHKRSSIGGQAFGLAGKCDHYTTLGYDLCSNCSKDQNKCEVCSAPININKNRQQNV